MNMLVDGLAHIWRHQDTCNQYGVDQDGKGESACISSAQV